MTKEGTSDDREQGKLLPITWPKDLPAIYANNLVVQNETGVLVLSFFQINPPYVIGTSEEQRKEILDKLVSVNAIPAAKLVIPLHHIPGMIEVIQKRFAQAGKEVEVTNAPSALSQLKTGIEDAD